jgi:diguanylate cyclase (GGDEF)-like protein
MDNPRDATRAANSQTASFFLTAIFALAAITATFFVSSSGLSFDRKTLVFVLIAAAYLAISISLFLMSRARSLSRADGGGAITDSVEGKLFALEEASEFFGASLKSSDMFRLVASRIHEIIPFAACVLFVADDGDKAISIKYAFGENPDKFAKADLEIDRTLAAKSFLSRSSQLDEANKLDRRILPRELSEKFGSAVAVPLFRNTEIFAVVAIYSKAGESYDGSTVTLAEAVAERIAPLFTSSFAFESSVSNALTDSLTNLPNQRGFFLVLENQIAESQRFRENRPLTVLALDIREFDEINGRHGHVIGDRILEFSSALVKKQLRQMDVLTRSAGDEFLAVLPTAGESTAEEIKDRISKAFANTPFEKLSGEKLFLELNFGSATFWRDGETAPDLLRIARVRKDQDKQSTRGKVLWFPKEFVN